MNQILIRLLKPTKQHIEFPAVLLRQTHGEIVVEAIWERPRLDLGYVVFETGDKFTEYYYTDRWYTIYAIRFPNGMLKGWYCNVARPALFDGAVLVSEDLEIDLFVPPDRQNMVRLDLDEFAARRFDEEDPLTYHAALHALAELENMAQKGMPPFHKQS